MNVLGVSGSPREAGNSELITNHALKALSQEGIETELISLAGKTILPCTACMSCQNEERCVLDDDLMPIYEKMKSADGIILTTPVYFGSATALIKGLMERTGYISRHNNGTLKGKVGGPLVVGRRGGLTFTFAQMNYWFHILEFYMVGASYWNIAFGRNKGEVSQDQEGLDTAWSFGKNMAKLMKHINA